MNLVNFLADDQFNTLRSRIGAPLSFYKLTISLPKAIFKERVQIRPAPLPVQGLDVDKGEITTHRDGTLIFSGQRVLVHIRDVTNIRGKQHMPRFHLANCTTLVEMRSSGRFARYVVHDRDDGVFYIRLESGPLRAERLLVCQNCLDKLSWEGFYLDMPRPKRHSVVNSFSIRKFFERYPRSLQPSIPEYTAQTAPVNEYPENWPDISNELRRQLRYQCQNCKLLVGETNKSFLHIHHKNGLRNDCRAENLQCLCLRCHADQPMHDHMKRLPEYSEFLRKFS